MKKFLFFVFGLVILSSSVILVEAASIDTKITSVYIWDMIVFRGEGFHRLHDVKITIYQDDLLVADLLTQTTNRGDLFMPLIINHLSPGKYDVLATDNIHTATTSFEINI